MKFIQLNYRWKGAIITKMLIFFLSFIKITTAFEPFSTSTAALVSLGAGIGYYYKEKISCPFRECCHDLSSNQYINSKPDFSDLHKYIFGQPIAIETVTRLISKHLKRPNPEKPLVLSFHGYTGIGKNHLVELLAKRIYPEYNRTGKSRFVHKFFATHLSTEDDVWKAIKDLDKALYKCERSLIIFDEIDKFSEGYIDTFLPFFDNNAKYKKPIFILIGNSGGSMINTETIRLLHQGKSRDDMVYTDFESVISEQSFMKGGLKNSEVVTRGMIDLFVPFLPLEMEQVEKCIVQYLKQHYNLANPYISPGRAFIDKVMEEINFKDRFSLFGCRRVASRVDTLYR